MSTRVKFTRRAILKIGMGAAAAVVSGKLLAEQNAESCGTPAQSRGPFYPKQDQSDKDLDLTLVDGHSELALGEIIYVSGKVMDEKLQPIAGALIDIWQANKHGRYHHEDDPNPAPLDTNFQGWGQIKSDAQGRYVFKTVIPGAYPVSQSWWRPPHIHFKVSMRGFHELTTQMYFSGHALNSKDRILQGIPDSERDKVIVEFIQGTKGDDPGSKRGQFDIVLCSVKKRQG